MSLKMSLRNITVPFQGTGQQTPATLALWSGRAKRNGRVGGMRSAAKRRAGGRKTRSAAAAPKRRKSARRGKARLVKGSPAARRYMAKIRKMRKRK